MSKIRHHVPEKDSDIDFAPEGDLQPFVIFTQLKDGTPHIYAGWVDAPDATMALTLACEHYGQDQPCTNIWAIPRQFIAGMRLNIEASKEPVPQRAYQLFTQKEAGDQHISDVTVDATSAAEALEMAEDVIPDHDSYHNVWAVPVDEIHATKPGEMIWRNTDQGYRLARGYSKGVREKWEQLRDAKSLEDYEKDNLTEMF